MAVENALGRDQSFGSSSSCCSRAQHSFSWPLLCEEGNEAVEEEEQN